MEERISGVKGTVKEMDTTVKENVKSKKKLLTGNIQEIWDTVKRPNLRTIEGKIPSAKTQKYFRQTDKKVS